jgi:glycosyltransferase involved in cell wall biosynthesis
VSPKVSFVIPCYKLAHLLPQCIESLLRQSYGDFEVLIMDDSSPDDTPRVAKSFNDARVQHIRNEPNLGHLKNYNKGIRLAQGEYVWLISADDFLRSSDALARYVDVMERFPKVGYVFCPAMRFQDGRETEIVGWSIHGSQDKVFTDHEFLKKLLKGNCVSAPTGMVRKTCYDTISVFPLDMPNSGDWYLWCIFALHCDVAYLAEPMVCYRTFSENMSETLKKDNPRVITEDNFRVRWTLKRKAREADLDSIVALCEDAIATYYANLVARVKYDPNIYRYTLEECEQSIEKFAASREEQVAMQARVYIALADLCYLDRDFAQARRYYRAGLRQHPLAIGALAKYSLLHLGPVGVRVRELMGALR